MKFAKTEVHLDIFFDEAVRPCNILKTRCDLQAQRSHLLTFNFYRLHISLEIIKPYPRTERKLPDGPDFKTKASDG